MCGIAGFINQAPRSGARALLERMNASLVHRGPDDAGMLVLPDLDAPRAGDRERGRPQVGLAMRRLSVIDLSGGHQPIPNEDESCWIVFNGEIYNHEELRRELERAGHVFRTHSDTEAILHAYEEWGVECVHRLRGMFAFAVWDARRERLFLARDPVGIKPLYWTEAGDRLLFASEIKALLRDPDVPRRVDEQSLHHYLTYLYAPAPRTMFAGISQLPPGHRLVWERGGKRVEEYWAGPEALLTGETGPPVSLDETWSVLREAVQAHMLSDVPLGAFLSGGLDSTLVVALMRELSPRPVQTFAIGFQAAGLYNELEFAREAAQTLGAEHHEFTIAPDSVRLLPEIIRHLDEPLADASVIPNYVVAQEARRHVKVALTGIGGDELFGGYQRYWAHDMARRWERVPSGLRRHLLLPALRRIPAQGDTALGDTSRLAQKFLEPLDLEPERRYLAWNAFFDERAKSRLYAEGRAAGPDSAAQALRHFARVPGRPFAERAMYADLKSYLPGDPLFLSDRMTMANSLEARVPFVDPRVMEFAARVPLCQKLQGRRTKVLLRELLRGRVPERLIERPKRGFGTPIDLWLNGELAGLVDRLLSPEQLRARGWFRPEYVRWMREQQAAGRRDFSQHLWALLVFELWQRAYIDADWSDHADLTFADLGVPLDTEQPRRPGETRSMPSEVMERSGRAATAPPPAEARGGAERPLRICMAADVDPIHVIGGAERMLNEHCWRLVARGNRVVVLTRRDDPKLPAEEEYRGVRVVRHPVGGIGPVGYVRTILQEGGRAFDRLHAEERFDIVNVHQPLAASALLSRPECRKLPVLYTYLSPWSDEYRIRLLKRNGPATAVARAVRGAWEHVNSEARERMERRALKRSDRMMVLSEFSASQITGIHGLSRDLITLIPGGVDTARFRPAGDRAALRRELGLPDGLLLLTVRNLEPRMGLDALVSAMQRVLRERPDAVLYIGGSGPIKGELQAQVQELGLEANIRFLGFIPEERLPDYYGVADLFVLPTRSLEGFGLVTVEALACGTPVAGTPVGGTQEILRGLDAEWLFPGTDAEGMAERLLTQIRRVETDGTLREQCRRYAEERYGWDVLVPQVERLMREMVGARAR